MENMTFRSSDFLIDEVLGKVGTPERNQYELQLNEELAAYKLGQALKKERELKKITQQQLGQMAGVARSAVSRVENGQNTSFMTLTRIFRAMNLKASIDIPGYGSIML